MNFNTGLSSNDHHVSGKKNGGIVKLWSERHNEGDIRASSEIVIEGKPDFAQSIKRIEAWYEGAMIDRPPVRFTKHNAEFEISGEHNERWNSLKERWFDAEFVVESFMKSIEGKTFNGETFPVLWPNLGPNVYAGFFGCEIEFGDETSWIKHIVNEPADVEKLKFDRQNEHFVMIEKIMELAFQTCNGKFLVGYTDLHFGMDCLVDWRGPENLCMDLYDNPELVKNMLSLASRHWEDTYNHFDRLLKLNDQMSVTWLGIPSHGRMHVSSCDFATMLSPEMFNKYVLQAIQDEVVKMTNNIFHLDGAGVARHLDAILEIPEIQAIQWVQGVGDDQPIMQWLDLIKRVRAAGKSIIVDLQLDELEGFIDNIPPEGLYLCIPAKDEQEEIEILKRLEKW